MVVENFIADMSGFIILFGFVFFGLILLCIFKPSRTKKYRRTIVDLYIAGKVRQLAEADKIDLDVEAQRYKTWRKNQRLEYQALDDTIETEVQDRVTELKETKK